MTSELLLKKIWKGLKFLLYNIKVFLEEINDEQGGKTLMAKNRFPGLGGGFNINQLQKQAKKMQEEIEKLHEELNQREIEVSSGGGAVKVVINGKKEIKSIQILPEVVDPEDVETLQDLIVACVNEAIRKVDKMVEEEMQKVTGFGIPGLF